VPSTTWTTRAVQLALVIRQSLITVAMQFEFFPFAQNPDGEFECHFGAVYEPLTVDSLSLS